MTEIILTPEQYMWTAIGAAAVFSCLGVLVGVFYERAIQAEMKARRLEEWARRLK